MKKKAHLRDRVEGIVVEADPLAPFSLVHHPCDGLRGLVPLPREHTLLNEVVERHLVVLTRLPHGLCGTSKKQMGENKKEPVRHRRTSDDV